MNRHDHTIKQKQSWLPEDFNLTRGSGFLIIQRIRDTQKTNCSHFQPLADSTARRSSPPISQLPPPPASTAANGSRFQSPEPSFNLEYLVFVSIPILSFPLHLSPSPSRSDVCLLSYCDIFLRVELLILFFLILLLLYHLCGPFTITVQTRS